MPIIDARYYKVLLICPNRQVTAEITPLLAYGLPLAPIHDVNLYPNRRQVMDLIGSVDPKICLLDFSNRTEAFTVLAELHSLLPQLPVIALLAADDPAMVLQCLRQGASDFLMRPFTTDQLDACVEKIARQLPAPSRSSSAAKVIAVMPAKGAAGATTIACNLAYQCKRLGANNILLADMDPLTGTISFLLKLKSTYSFIDVLHREHSLEADLWKQMTNTVQGVDVLLSPENLVDPIAELHTAGPIVEFAQSMYQAVVLDCGGVYGTWNLSLARLADEVLLVSTNELASLHAAQRAMLYMETQRVEMGKVKLVVNRYEKEAGLQSEYFKDAFGTEAFHVIPSDNDAVQKSLMDGKPIQGSSQIGKSLSAMANKLVERREADGKKNSKGLLSSFFR
ncbi:MAG TPA: AAA family ATPase [Bryobacteraceae bacterium]|nr:AAA family ATPase [Bryobacteraceae bacterium]